VKDGEVIMNPEIRSSLPIRRFPVSVTIGLLGDKILVDPTSLEESAIDTSIVLGWSDDDEMAAIQKNLQGLIQFGVMDEIINVSKEKAGELRTRLMEAVGRVGGTP